MLDLPKANLDHGRATSARTHTPQDNTVHRYMSIVTWREGEAGGGVCVWEGVGVAEEDVGLHWRKTTTGQPWLREGDA